MTLFQTFGRCGVSQMLPCLALGVVPLPVPLGAL
jgi:hypothetical protein